jgi:hypothetical protein
VAVVLDGLNVTNSSGSPTNYIVINYHVFLVSSGSNGRIQSTTTSPAWLPRPSSSWDWSRGEELPFWGLTRQSGS